MRLIRAPLFPTRIKIPQDWVPDGIITAYFETTAQLTATAIPGFTRTANLSTSAQLSAVIFAKATAVGNLTASAQLSATVAEREFVTANMSATAQLSASTIVGFARTANFTTDAQLSATDIKAQYVRTAGFSADASLTATTFPRYVMTVPLSATATLAATVVEREIATANFTAAAQLSASVMARIALTANLSADASLTAIARKPFPTITATAQTTTTTTTNTSLAVNLSTADVGDTRVVIFESYNTSPSTPPAGWTTVARQVNGSMACLAIYRRVKVAGDPDTVTFTVSTTSAAAQCLTIVNCGSLNLFALSQSTTSTTAHSTAAVPNTAPGGLVIRAIAYRATVYGQSHTWPAGVTALPTVNTPSGNPDTLSVVWSIQESISAGSVVTATAPASRPYNAFTVVATPPAPVATLKEGRINLASSQTATNNVPLELNGWNNDPSYPLTVSTTRGLVVQGDGAGYITINFTRQSYYTGFTLTVKADGEAIYSTTGGSTATTLTNQIMLTSDFVDGTLLTYEFLVSNTVNSSGIVTTTNTNMTMTPIVAGFTPSGMTKDIASMAMGTSSPTQITGVVAESGSTLSGNALVANSSGTTIIRGQVALTGSYGSSYTAEIRRNGTAIPGATVSGGDAMEGAPVLVIPPTSVSVTAGDLITLWITNPGSNCTIAGGVNTFVRLTAS